MLDRLLGLAEVEVQATEVVEQPADVSLVVDLLVVGLRALSVIARLDPVPHPLADKRSLEVRVRGLARIVERLRELERALLRSLAGGDNSASASRGCPRADGRTEARSPRPASEPR